jgi:1-hydroxycarotenoid 3,4-desaturase
MRSTLPVIVIGAGFGGLAAAMQLAGRGLPVLVLEAMSGPGGKALPMVVGPHALEAGPTVFTMKSVFEDLFSSVGVDFDQAVQTTPLFCLARHFWPDGSQLDLFVDQARSIDAIGYLAGATAADEFRRFARDSRAMFEALDRSFMRSEQPHPFSLVRRAGLGAMLAIRPFSTLWGALGEYFTDPRLRQLFGRYATYCGSSPFLAPATLMLIAHAEMAGVWALEGGLPALARVMAGEICRLGGEIRYGERVKSIDVVAGRAAGVTLANGDRITATAVIYNGESEALVKGLFGNAVQKAVPARPVAMRTLSAVTVSLAGHVFGPGLPMHSVFFSRDYPAEFRALANGRIPEDPTLYLCSLDRRDDLFNLKGGEERFLALINAPARGDDPAFETLEPRQCQDKIVAALARHGVQILPGRHLSRTMTPQKFEALFPGSGGSLYGQATHGAMASFRRPGARTTIPGLYCVGGSVHPGAGVPMATLSGNLAVRALLKDLASISRSRPVATPGGISTPSAPIAGMH